MSDTPRTDAALMCELRDMAGKLERELTAAKGEIERLRAVIKDSNANLLEWRARHDIKPRPEWLAAQAALKEPK